MQNETNKLAMLQQLASAQRDLAMQQAAERRMKATRGDMPALVIGIGGLPGPAAQQGQRR